MVLGNNECKESSSHRNDSGLKIIGFVKKQFYFYIIGFEEQFKVAVLVREDNGDTD